MPEEQTQDQIEEQVEDVQDDPVEDAEPTEPSPTAVWFSERFGVDYDSLPPDQREQMMVHAMKEQPKPADPPEADGRDTVEPRYLDAVARLSNEDIDIACQAAVDGGDPEKTASLLKSMAGALRELPALFNQVTGQMHETVTDLKQDRDLSTIRQHVPNATEADIAVAKQLCQDGEVTSHRAALELAVFRRTSRAPKRTPDDTARRRASAIRASTVAQGGEPNGIPTQRMPANDQEWKKILARGLESGDLFAS